MAVELRNQRVDGVAPDVVSRQARGDSQALEELASPGDRRVDALVFAARVDVPDALRVLQSLSRFCARCTLSNEGRTMASVRAWSTP